MDTKLHAVDPNTGAAKNTWPVTTGGYVTSSPGIGADGTVYVGSHDGKLYAFNPNATYKWPPLQLGGSIQNSGPAIGPDGTIYIGAQDYKVYAVNPTTAQVQSGWPYRTGYTVRSSQPCIVRSIPSATG